MKTAKFLVRIEETLSRCVEVEVETGGSGGVTPESVANAALAKAREKYNSGEVVLGADDFAGVDFSIVGYESKTTPSGWKGVGR